MVSRAGAVWQRRSVLGLLIKRDFKSKYEGTFLGYVWALLEPLLLTALYWVVFTQLLDVSSRLAGPIDADEPAEYGLFLIAGILPWLWFNGSVSQGTKALTKQSKLITTMQLPRELFALEAVGSKFVEFVVSLLVLPIFALIAGRLPNLIRIVGALYAVAMQMVLIAGLTLILSAVTVLVPDIKRTIRVVLRTCFYLSPVLYSAAVVQERLGRFYEIYQLNPLATFFQLHRAVWFHGTLPQLDQLIITSVLCPVVLGVGWWVFRALEPRVLKEL